MKFLTIILIGLLCSCGSDEPKKRELSFSEKVDQRDEYCMKTRVGDTMNTSIYSCMLLEDNGEWVKYKIYPYFYTVKGDKIVAIWRNNQ